MNSERLAKGAKKTKTNPRKTIRSTQCHLSAWTRWAVAILIYVCCVHHVFNV